MINGACGTDADYMFQSLCHEAVVACGDDLPAVRRYVAARIAALDEDTRRSMARDVERVLAFIAPDRPRWEQ